MLTHSLKVEEGGQSTITKGHILISDVDTKLENIRIHLLKLPLHGTVELNENPMNQRDWLTCEDLQMSKVRLGSFDFTTVLGFFFLEKTEFSDNAQNLAHY